MKNRDILGLTILGIIAWFFLKPKLARAEEITEVPKPEVPKPEVYTASPRPIIAIPYPKPGFYFAELIPLAQERLPVTEKEVAGEEKPLSLYEQMEFIIQRAGT